MLAQSDNQFQINILSIILSITNKWSKNFDVKPHHRGRIFTGEKLMDTGQLGAMQLAATVMLTPFFVAYTTAVIHNVF